MFSKTTLHVIRALLSMAHLRPNEYAGAGSLAREIGAPENYLGKKLQVLARLGLLESQRGKVGGFRLARDANALSLAEVVAPFEPIDQWEGCALGLGQCLADDLCALHERWGPVREAYLGLLRTTTLGDLLTSGVIVRADSLASVLHKPGDHQHRSPPR